MNRSANKLIEIKVIYGAPYPKEVVGSGLFPVKVKGFNNLQKICVRIWFTRLVIWQKRKAKELNKDHIMPYQVIFSKRYPGHIGW